MTFFAQPFLSGRSHLLPCSPHSSRLVTREFRFSFDKKIERSTRRLSPAIVIKPRLPDGKKTSNRTSRCKISYYAHRPLPGPVHLCASTTSFVRPIVLRIASFSDACTDGRYLARCLRPRRRPSLVFSRQSVEPTESEKGSRTWHLEKSCSWMIRRPSCRWNR
jgi:hypothetical protein